MQPLPRQPLRGEQPRGPLTLGRRPFTTLVVSFIIAGPFSRLSCDRCRGDLKRESTTKAAASAEGTIRTAEAPWPERLGPWGAATAPTTEQTAASATRLFNFQKTVLGQTLMTYHVYLAPAHGYGADRTTGR